MWNNTLKLDSISGLRAERLWRICREAFWVGTGQAAAALGALATVRFFTEILSLEVYGQLTLSLTIATLCSQTILGPLANSASRFFAISLEASQLPAYFSSTWRLAMMASALMAFGLILACTMATILAVRDWSIFLPAAFGFALASGWCGVLDSVQNAARERAVVAWHHGLAPWLRLGMAVLLVAWLGPIGQVAVVSYLCAPLIVLISQLFFFRRRIRALAADQRMLSSHGDFRLTAQMVAYAAPFAVWGVFGWAQIASDRWALEIFTTTSNVGLYAVLYQLGWYPIMLVTGMVMQLSAPLFYKHAGDASDRRRLKDLYRVNRFLVVVTLVFTSVAVAIALQFHQLIFGLLAAPGYGSVSFLLPWMVLAGGLFAAGQISSLVILSHAWSIPLMRPKIVTALLGVGLNCFGAFWFGLIGIVASALISSSVYLGWITWSNHKAAVFAGEHA